MKIPHPKSVESSYAGARAEGCDCVMLKHDGLPVVISCDNVTCNIFSDFKVVKPAIVESLTLSEPGSVTFAGLHNKRLDKIYVYDMWSLGGESCTHLSYRERYLETRRLITLFHNPRFELIPVLPIQAAEELWKTVIADPANHKGLIFRRSKDNAAGNLYIVRYYVEFPTALV